MVLFTITTEVFSEGLGSDKKIKKTQPFLQAPIRLKEKRECRDCL